MPPVIEAAQTIITYAFKIANLNRIVAYTHNKFNQIHL